MLFLLPPSETKAIGGGSLTIEQAALTFGGLNTVREKVLAELVRVCKKPALAAQVLKLSPKQLAAIEVNLQVSQAPTMRALERYTGTLYDAIEPGSLSSDAWLRAKPTVLIQSPLFGLIPATDLIPNYRLSGTTVLPKVSLKKVWPAAHEPIFGRLAQGLIVDLRSKTYVDLAPIPSTIDSVWVEVVSRESNGQLRALNHFNKLAKGLFIRAILEAPSATESIDDLSSIASKIGMELYLDEAKRQLVLVTDQIVKSKRAQ
jgi:cytoplasmic iron level regulating protein YaaA (DUF328/UPF0246 family)